MSRREILVDSDGGRLRAALLVDGRIEALEVDIGRPGLQTGRILRARVVRATHGLGDIVALPDGTELLLQREPGPPPPAGASLIVQIVRTGRGGKIGVATRSIALTGRALIHRPRESGIRYSRRLAVPDDRRTAFARALEGRPGAWIVRRTAAALPLSDFEGEIAALAAEGAGLGGEASVQPTLPLPSPDAFRRLAADWGTPDPARILVDGRPAEIAAASWAARFAPRWSGLIARHDRSGPAGGAPTLFDDRDIETAIAELSDSRVALPQGGSLVIERTEALTAIDVNAGSQANGLAVNLAAAGEIARQLRLRHIGGIIVVDFVSMPKRRDGTKVVTALESALDSDPAQTRVLPMSAFGLVEMTRERRGSGLETG